MSKKKPPVPLRLDATGLNAELPSIRDILANGSAAEVREELRSMGSLLLSGMDLSRTEAAWLGQALVAIGSGQVDANAALRLVERNNASFPSLRERLVLFAQYDDLYAQCGSQARALGLMASWRLQEKYGHSPSYEQACAERDKLKKLIQSRNK